MPALTILRGGMLTTVQDLGRWGLQHLGIPVAGPMDWYSHRLANRLVGNDESAAAIEMTLLGPELTSDEDVLCAVAGAAMEVALGEDVVPTHAPFRLPRGRRLRFRMIRPGARGTLAIRGGIDVPAVLGSRATSLVSHVGPFGGRALAAGDVLGIGVPPASSGGAGLPLPLPPGGARLRVILGPHDSRFSAAAVAALTHSRYTVTPQSNRMGYRLAGPPLLVNAADAGDMLSEATPVGSIQVPASGLPILLMADRQTTGGYPKIATMITADLPLAGQLAPGDWVEFVPVSRAAALDALRQRVAALSAAAR
ncbi:MAG: biotin-dependent carboxyltransferase family protein [Vicinamibacterales bacterium]